MNLSLSKGGRPASVKNRAWHYCQMAWRGVCNQKALSRLAAFSPLLLLGMGQMAHATDLLAGGKDDVKATFGADSFVIMCIYIAEIVIGVATYNTLPVMYSVLLGMTIALFPVLIVLAVVSSLSWTIIKGYVYTIAYLQMWPILFSILNHAMNFYLQGKLSGTAVTLANFDQVQNTYSDIGTTAGWLALSIPFIAWGMVKGLGQVVSQAGNYLGQTLQSASTQSSSQTIDGMSAGSCGRYRQSGARPEVRQP
ncbi:TPA: conjugal transfer protein TraG N-terminal domain-containing protein [Escherichia coli]